MVNKNTSKQHYRNIFLRFQESNPTPRGELEFRNRFTLLVAVILSARATDKAVNAATKDLFAEIEHPHQLLALGEEQLAHRIRTIGLYRNKAANIMKTAQLLIDRHGGEVPGTVEELEALPGVGRKTANVILNTAFCQPTLAVDTHVSRVSRRLGLAKGTTPLSIERDLHESIPPEFLQRAHHWLVLHGRYVCKSRKPLCKNCIVADLCNAPEKNS